MTRGSGRADERAISEILGTVLLISLVLFVSAVVIVMGASMISDAQDRTRTEAASDYLQELDSELTTLAAGADQAAVEFNPQDTPAREYHLQREGTLNVTINGNPDCSFEQPLSTIVYDGPNGNTVGYEAGGVVRGGWDGSAFHTAPDVSFTDGTLNVRLVNLTGHLDQSSNMVTVNGSATRDRTEEITAKLLRHDCPRPDTVTIRVNSEFGSAWRDYLVSETGASAGNVNTLADGTVEVVIDEDRLHPSANDEENNVINLGGAPYMDSVTLDDGKPPELGVDKGATNTYMVYAGPLTNDSLDLNRRVSIDGTNVTGPPMDISLVIDESGSMNGAADPACSFGCQSKSEAAQDAAEQFTGGINESRDRIGIVGYNDRSRYVLIDDERYFVHDKSKINDTIDTEISAGGSTRIDRGLADSNAMFDLKSNETQRKITILLSDGKNNCGGFGYCPADPNTIAEAEIAAERDVTIFTVGFGRGSNLDEVLLQDVADETGGEYFHAEDSDELEEAFEEIGNRIRAEDAIANTPITSNVTNSTGTHFVPEIPGDVDHLARASRGGQTFLNVNDPTAPALFSHSFPIDDDETFTMNVTEYECADGHYNVTGEIRTVGGNTYAVARCTEFAGENESYGGAIYVDGQRPDRLLETTYAPWQTDVNETLNRFPSIEIDPATGELDTTSNQAIVVYDLPPNGSGTHNTMTLFVRIGLAETDAQGTGIVTVRVAEAEVG